MVAASPPTNASPLAQQLAAAGGAVQSEQSPVKPHPERIARKFCIVFFLC